MTKENSNYTMEDLTLAKVELEPSLINCNGVARKLPRVLHAYDKKGVDKYPENLGTLDGRSQEIRSFNRKLTIDLQKKLKSRKPEITSALVLATLHTWKLSKRYSYMGNRVPGAVYQSLDGICSDLPWLDRSTVQRSIKRLEKAFPRDFKVDRKSTKILNFEISEKLTKEYFQKIKGGKNSCSANLSFRVLDAMQCGVLEAVLIRNLEYKTEASRVVNPLLDVYARIYGEMSPSKLSRIERDPYVGKPSFPIIPFGRQCITEAIQNLKKAEIFIEHPQKRGFYCLEREKIKMLGTPEFEKNSSSPNAAVSSLNATISSSNATVMSPNAIIYSRQIERDGNEDEIKIESEKEAIDLQLTLKTIANFKFDESYYRIAKNTDCQEIQCFNLKSDKNQFAEVSSYESRFQNVSHFETAEKPPIFFKDVFPDLLEEVERLVKKYREISKIPTPRLDPDLLDFEIYSDPVALSWIETELDLNPITGVPIDYRNFEEQIDIALFELEVTYFFRKYSKNDILNFRSLFRKYQGLNVPMIQKIFDRICHADELQPFKATKRIKYDHFYFSRRMKNLKVFNRYFTQIFRETFAPFVNENGESRSVDGKLFRWWPTGEEYYSGDYIYPLSSSFKDMPEPFISILKNDVADEQKKMNEILSSDHSI